VEAAQETGNLIASDKVQGPTSTTLPEQPWHNSRHHDRHSQVAYAIMSFGGFLGIGNQYHPLLWSVLKYDTGKGGYGVNLDKRQLEGAPAYNVDEEPNWGDRTYETKIHDYYGVGPYWAQ
jgi:hypothetical protein